MSYCFYSVSNFVKLGLDNGRKSVFVEDLNSRRKQKLAEEVVKEAAEPVNYGRTYELRPPCKDGCSHKCREQFTEAEPKVLHADFWQQSLEARRLLVFASVKVTARAGKRAARVYTLNDLAVCKTFFLNSLVFKSDKPVTNLLRSSGEPELLTASPTS